MKFEDGSDVGWFVGADPAAGDDKTVVSLIINGRAVWYGSTLSVVRHKPCGAIQFFYLGLMNISPGMRFPNASAVVYPDGHKPKPMEKVRDCPSCRTGFTSQSSEYLVEVVGDGAIDTPKPAEYSAGSGSTRKCT